MIFSENWFPLSGIMHQMIVWGQKVGAPPGRDHSREQGPVQIIFTKKNMASAAAPAVRSARQRLDEIAETLALIRFFADVAEHGEEIVRPHIAGRARHLALLRRQRLERAGPFREKLEGRREAH